MVTLDKNRDLSNDYKEQDNTELLMAKIDLMTLQTNL